MIEMADIPGTYNVEDPGWKQAFYGGSGSGPGYGYTGGTGSQFFPTFGGQAQDFRAGAASSPWSPVMRRRRLQMGGGRNAFAASGARRDEGAGMTGAGSGPQQFSTSAVPLGQGIGGMSAWIRDIKNAGWQPGQPIPSQFTGESPEQFSMAQGPLGSIGDLLQNALRGGSGSFGGLFGYGAPEGIMQGIRQQAVQDAGARERAARLGLQARGDVDPSTYGFQALMSQLGGQRDTAQAMSQANLGIQQQQLQNYWDMLRQALSGQLGVDLAERQGRWQRASNSPWGQIAQGAGQLAGSFFGG